MKKLLALCLGLACLLAGCSLEPNQRPGVALPIGEGLTTADFVVWQEGAPALEKEAFTPNEEAEGGHFDSTQAASHGLDGSLVQTARSIGVGSTREELAAAYSGVPCLVMGAEDNVNSMSGNDPMFADVAEYLEFRPNAAKAQFTYMLAFVDGEVHLLENISVSLEDIAGDGVGELYVLAIMIQSGSVTDFTVSYVRTT